MNTSKELNYRLYIQREENFVRQDVRKEFSSYDWIRYGEVEKIKSSIPGRKKNFYEGKGILSSNPLRNITYHFVISVAMIARVCMDAGMSHDEAYTLSDLYIRKVDLMTDPNKVLDLLYDMQIDFAERMQKVIKYEKNYLILFIQDMPLITSTIICTNKLPCLNLQNEKDLTNPIFQSSFQMKLAYL